MTDADVIVALLISAGKVPRVFRAGLERAVIEVRAGDGYVQFACDGNGKLVDLDAGSGGGSGLGMDVAVVGSEP